MARTSFIFLLLLVASFSELSAATNICTWGFYMCASNSECIRSRYRCDGTRHCTNGEDERNCPSRCSGRFTTGFFKCSNNHCLSRYGLCDGDNDCGDGIDESTDLCGGTAFPVRLVGGRWPSEGRVEVYYSPTASWGTICDDDWDVYDANVVCRQLGLPPAAQVVNKAGFGRGLGPILLGNLQCTGSELTLSKCKSRGWKRHDCDHSEDAGVVCGTQVPTGTSPIRCSYCSSTTRDDQCSTVTCPHSQRFCYRKTAYQYIKGSSFLVTVADCTTTCTSNEIKYLCRHEINCKRSCCRTSLCNNGSRSGGSSTALQCYSCSSSSNNCKTMTCPFDHDHGYCYKKTAEIIIGGSRSRVTAAGCRSSCTSAERRAECRYEKNCQMSCCTSSLCNRVDSSYPSCYTCSSASSYHDCQNNAILTNCISKSARCYKIDYKMSSSCSEVIVYKKGCTTSSSFCSQVRSTCSGLKGECNVRCCKGSGCNAGSIQRFSVVVLVTCAVAFLVLGYPAVKPSYYWI